MKSPHFSASFGLYFAIMPATKIRKMKYARKHMSKELDTLKRDLKALLDKSMDTAERTRALLRVAERKIEDNFALLESFQTTSELAAKKFRKQPNLTLPEKESTSCLPFRRLPHRSNPHDQTDTRAAGQLP